MNKMRFTILSAVFLLALSAGCSSEPVQSAPITIEELPGDVVCGDTSLSLASFSFCEVYANHGYTGYCVATVDRSNLSDDDVYWLLNRDSGDICAEFQANAYLSSERNSLDNERMSLLQTIYNGEKIYFTFYTDDVYREHLDDFEVTLQMIASPEKDLTASTTQYYYYHQNAESGVNYSDYGSVLSEDELVALADALNAKIDSLG